MHPRRSPESERPRASLVGYGVAVASVVAATALRLALDPVLGTRFPFATLFFAVLVTAWLGGFGPALLATALGGITATWALLPPRGTLQLDGPETLGGLVLYLAVSLGIAWIGGAMRRAEARAAAAAREADADREELAVTLHSIGDAVITTDVHGCVTSMNEVAASLTGWAPPAAAGRPLDEVFRIIDEESRERAPNPVRRALAEGRVVGLANHTLLVARDGSERPIDDSAAPIRAAGGAVRGAVLVFRDVSARRRAETQLRSSERELADLFENANVGMHLVDADGIVLRANRAELEMLGYAREEYVGRPIAEFHADPPVIADILARLAAGEALVGYPARMRCKDGSLRDVLINSSALWEDGRFVHTRCFMLDVTARTRAEEAQALLAAVVESSDDAIVTKSLDGVVTSWNRGAERIFGYTREEAVGQPITLIIPPERRDEEREFLARLRRGERVEPFETERVAKSGARLRISLSISPVRGPDGRIIGASKVARDVTERHRVAEALRESEERFRTMADNIAQFAWMADGEGSIFWYNRRWFDYTGTTLAEMKGWGWKAVHHPDHVERVVEKISRCFRNGEVWEDTFPLRGADGRYRWFLSRAIPIRDEEGRVTRWFGTNTDITAQREAEQALKEADRRKDEFIATLAHELRNPLAPVRSSLEILKLGGGDAAQRERATATIDRQVAQLERLVDDLLDVARISRDRLTLRPERIELAAVVEQAVEASMHLCESTGVALDLELPAEPIVLDGDAARLAQVLGNLLSNACKFTPAGGSVRLAARRAGGEAIVSVRDTGRGIPPEKLSAVFEMFAQIDPTTDGPRPGLGIGLSLVRRLVEMHGGRVEARSEGRGRGSEFVVRLPLAAAHRRAVPAAPAVAKAVARRRILVVDDNVDAADSLAILLRIAGHETAVAHDGESAIKAAEEQRPDVVLLDLGLPRMNGHDVARKIREEAWGRGIALVALTGWGEEENRRKSQEAGFDHHLVKPVHLDTLNDLLASLEGDCRG